MLKTDAIKQFLKNNTKADLANIYNAEMECQVNVAQDNGERVENIFKGKTWHGWTDGITTWKSFRIPFKAYSEPEYTDSHLTFDITTHAEGIGMTGWNWKQRKSFWVAYDFDAMIGHSDKHTKKLSIEELDSIKESLSKIPWVTLRKSTSGKGLHVYVFITPTETKNHNEHSALARAILGLMCAITGHDFVTKVDVCGGNMWVWHRKMKGTDGLEIIKQGEVLKEIPHNWESHLNVIIKKQIKPKGLPDNFNDLAAQNIRIPLDDEHKRLIDFMSKSESQWWWDSDFHMLVAHTKVLKNAHTQLKMRGIFETISEGTDLSTPNAFLFPLHRGSWAVRRYSMGTAEHTSWEQDSGGWTKTFLNRDPDLSTIAKASGGIEDEKGFYHFETQEKITEALLKLGVTLDIPITSSNRPLKLSQHKDGRIIVSFPRFMDNEKTPPGWLEEQKKKQFTRILDAKLTAPKEIDIYNLDDQVRHLVNSSKDDCGWMIKIENTWNTEPLTHIKMALLNMGLSPGEINANCGSCVMRPWELVHLPFEPEYPGNRQWNLNSAQLKYAPRFDTDEFECPTWDMILLHCGKNLDPYVSNHVWCKENGILTGADYLKCWLASLYKNPTEPLPYLFFYGPQNSGKSIFHEAQELLLTKGYVRAEQALTNQSGFNGELDGAILCVIEEIDLSKNNAAYNRIKDWVTARSLSIRRLYTQTVMLTNTTHWIQVANDHSFCPIFPGDTRITMINVNSLENEIPKRELIDRLRNEAPDFISSIIHTELPKPYSRLGIPVIITDEKRTVQHANQSTLTEFLEQHTKYAEGYSINLSEFYERFTKTLDPNELFKWTKQRVSKEMPPEYSRGRVAKDGGVAHHYGNIAWVETNTDEKRIKYIPFNGMLKHASDSVRTQEQGG